MLRARRRTARARCAAHRSSLFFFLFIFLLWVARLALGRTLEHVCAPKGSRVNSDSAVQLLVPCCELCSKTFLRGWVASTLTTIRFFFSFYRPKKKRKTKTNLCSIASLWFSMEYLIPARAVLITRVYINRSPMESILPKSSSRALLIQPSANVSLGTPDRDVLWSTCLSTRVASWFQWSWVIFFEKTIMILCLAVSCSNHVHKNSTTRSELFAYFPFIFFCERGVNELISRWTRAFRAPSTARNDVLDARAEPF